jgi:hypothetical protein
VIAAQVRPWLSRREAQNLTPGVFLPNERPGRATGAISLHIHPPSDFFCCYPSPRFFFDLIARPRRRLAPGTQGTVL